VLDQAAVATAIAMLRAAPKTGVPVFQIAEANATPE
jgi:hypothetical protein